jgi:cytochrome P450
VLLTALVALPMVGLIGWSGLRARRDAVDRARVQTQRLADSLVAEQQAVAAGAQQLFYSLAQLPEVRRHDPSLQPMLAELLRLKPSSRGWTSWSGWPPSGS